MRSPGGLGEYDSDSSTYTGHVQVFSTCDVPVQDEHAARRQNRAQRGCLSCNHMAGHQQDIEAGHLCVALPVLSAPCQISYASLGSSGQSLANNSVPRERLGLELENTGQTGCKLFQLEEQRQSLPWAIVSFKPDRLSSSACNPLAWAGKHLHGACRGRRVVLVHPIVAQSPHVCAFARPRDK